MTKGDVIKGEKTDHPIVFIKNDVDDQFIGCMITHSSSDLYPNNIGLKSAHFFEKDDEGNDWKIKYDNSYFVELYLIKRNDWGPYKIKGRLTQDGVEFVEKYLKGKTPIWWNEYNKK